MKLSDVVRGVEEKDTDGFSPEEIGGKAWNRAKSYNSLASAEVVVDRERIFEIIVDIALPLKITEAIATAIESGSIISLKEEE